MDTRLFAILDRARHSSAALASVNHFTLDDGQSASAALLIEEPGWTPYCLDDENRRVLFVHTPDHVDLSQAVFVYSAQFEQAQRALVVPYTALNAVTATLKAPDTMIFIAERNVLIKQRFEEGEALTDIAVDFNISPQRVWQIVYGKVVR